MTQHRPPVGRAGVEHPVRLLPEHGHQVTLTFVVGDGDREGDDPSRLAPTDLQGCRSLRHESRSGDRGPQPVLDPGPSPRAAAAVLPALEGLDGLNQHDTNPCLFSHRILIRSGGQRSRQPARAPEPAIAGRSSVRLPPTARTARSSPIGSPTPPAAMPSKVDRSPGPHRPDGGTTRQLFRRIGRCTGAAAVAIFRATDPLSSRSQCLQSRRVLEAAARPRATISARNQSVTSRSRVIAPHLHNKRKPVTQAGG